MPSSKYLQVAQRHECANSFVLWFMMSKFNRQATFNAAMLTFFIALVSHAFALGAPPRLQTQSAHFSAVRALAFSPSASLIASGSDDQTIKLWDARTGKACGTIVAGQSAVSSLAFGGDEILASGSDDKTVKIWDVKRGIRVRTLTGHIARIEAVAFSPNGKLLASASDDKTVKIWDANRGILVRTLTGHAAAVNAIAFSPDGKTLVSGAADKSVKIWDVSNLSKAKSLRTLSGHESWVTSVAFSPNGKIIASAGWDQTVKLWDASSGHLLNTLRPASGWVNALAFNTDGSFLVAGADKIAAIWSVADGKLNRKIAMKDRVNAVAFVSADVLVAAVDNSAAFFNARNGQMLTALKGYSGREDRATLAHLWNAQGASSQMAIECYQKACNLAPKNSLYATNLAAAYAQKTRFAAAQELLNRRLQVLAAPDERNILQTALADVEFQWAQHLAQNNKPAAAIAHYRAALQFDTKARPPNAALGWYRLGSAQDALNHSTDAAQSYQKARALFRQSGDAVSEAVTLNALGLALQAQSEFERADNAFQQALKISRDADDKATQGAALSNLAMTQHARGRYDAAVANLDRALKIKRELGDEAGEGTVLNNLGLVNQSLTNYSQAIDFYTSALAIHQKLNNQAQIADTLNNIGANYDYLGLYQKAIAEYDLALKIYRQKANQRKIANTLGNIGHAYFYLKQPEKAISFYDQSLATQRALKDRAGMGVTLSNLALAYNALEQYTKATTYAQDTLTLTRAIDDREGEGLAFNTLGLIDYSSGNYPASARQFERALPILQAVKARALQAKTLRNLMVAWREMKKPTLAIFYGKQAVNLNQAMRADIQSLDKETQKSFLAARQNTYRELADILIGQGRLPEAQQVLDMLKEEEYFNFVHRDGAATEGLDKRAELSPTEADWEKRYKEISDRVTGIGVERGELLLKDSRTPEEEKKLAKLEEDLTIAGKAFQSFLDKMAEEAASSPEASDQVTKIRDAQGLMEDLRELGHGAVALYTLVGETKYRIILITPDAQVAAEYPITAAELNRKVLSFRQVLQNPDLDPLPLAQELYKILLGPIAPLLKNANAETLMWCLDGVLRYVPMDALNDGQKYLVENFRNTVFTPCSQARLKDEPKNKWKALGLGVSKAQEGFNPLPGVTEELHGIIISAADTAAAPATTTPVAATAEELKGVIPGQVKLDEAFTVDAMKAALRQRYPVVHVASHFNFKPGNESDSFLLLGDGSHLSLEEIKNLPNVFAGVDLLTLSACDTATGGVGADGKEVEGFGVLAQRQGAKSVLASLWPVADESTKLLMPEFYRLRETEDGILKAEALRQAQLLLLTGKVKGSGSVERRGSRLANEDSAAMAAGAKSFTVDPTKPFAHPHYWAPFILIGNWL